MSDFDIIQETYNSFCICSSQYIQKDKHWGSDLDIINNEINEKENLKILDAGCGSAWHLINLKYLIADRFQLFGIDYSEGMLEIARKFIKINKMQNNINLKKQDILKTKFDNSSFNVVIFFNNTLGNLPSLNIKRSVDARMKALHEINRILSKKGKLILSVYNAEKLDLNDYGGVFKVDYEKSSLHSNDIILRFSLTNRDKYFYYSHWFTKEEIIQLLEKNNFVIKSLEFRRKRIIAVAHKMEHSK